MAEQAITAGPFPLLSLPLDIFLVVTTFLRVHHLKQLMETSKAVNAITNSAFWRNVRTRCNTLMDSAGLTQMLRLKPLRAHLIRSITLDQMDELSIRELLAIDLPNLEKLFVRHHGTVETSLSPEEKADMNRALIPKPKLTSLTIDLMAADGDIVYPVRSRWICTKEDAAIFQHPSLKRLRIRYVGIKAFEDSSVEVFPFQNLEEFHINIANCSLESISKFLKNACSLKTLRYHSIDTPMFTPESFVPLLRPSRNTLVKLKLFWRRCWCSHSYGMVTNGMSLANFPAMKLLQLNAKVIFGQHFSKDDLPGIIHRRLPPNLKVLMLDEVVQPRVSEEPASIAMGDREKALMDSIVEIKTDYLPKLRFITYTDGGSIISPLDLCDTGAKNGVVVLGTDMDADPNPSYEWLESPSIGENMVPTGPVVEEEDTFPG